MRLRNGHRRERPRGAAAISDLDGLVQLPSPSIASLSMARVMGIALPALILGRTDEVIE